MMSKEYLGTVHKAMGDYRLAPLATKLPRGNVPHAKRGHKHGSQSALSRIRLWGGRGEGVFVLTCFFTKEPSVNLRFRCLGSLFASGVSLPSMPNSFASSSTINHCSLTSASTFVGYTGLLDSKRGCG
jgi:hypothetical protein